MHIGRSLLLCLLLAGCKSGADDPCKLDAECREGLVCVRSTAQRSEPRCMVRAMAEEACKLQPMCASEGLCAPRDGECRATADADCEASQGCKRLGWCTAKEGKCIAGDNADCQEAPACKREGHCTA